ncbi:hypothetical protein POM88_024146 [Heracleum sosnowskyi]|uniref:Uncharacterized protein n=1 Tax=Heracleum sosnowskyi TaxID=360622 RepID=A0AAD8MLP3_9APIA|nr:hypothetical protein POM88_024146 [Heracleum sosnowskyi]
MRAQDPQINLDEMNTLLDTQFKAWMLNKAVVAWLDGFRPDCGLVCRPPGDYLILYKFLMDHDVVVNATVANLKIDISGATNVHGIIAARNSQLKNPACTSVLFWKSPANEIEVGCDGVIPLFKSCVGVPLVSVLYVDIALYIDGEIYTNTVSFVPQIAGEKLENLSIPNKETKIGVQVKWDSRKNSIYSTYHFLYWEREDEYDSDEDEYDSEEDTEG